MAANQIFQLFDKATSPDESQQLEFVRRIPEILASFNQNWIITKFIPFLENWLPKDNEKILSALIINIPQIVSAVGSIFNVCPIIEQILIADNQDIVKQLLPVIMQFEHDPTCFQFVAQLIVNEYDCVRAFVPLIINLAGNDENKSKIFPSLTYDPSFRVRVATAKIINSNINDDLGIQTALTLIEDNHPKIRAFIPVVATPRQFYGIYILPKIVSDFDWSVRASVAQELIHCTDFDIAVQYCMTLAADPVWQVRLCALKSLRTLLTNSKSTSISQEFIKLLSDTLKFPYISLKKCVIDLLLHNFPKVMNLVDVFWQQDNEMRMYFLSQINAKNIHKLIPKNRIIEAIDGLIKSDDWRIRKDATELFIAAAKSYNDQQIAGQLSEICVNLLADEAAPVREAAALQLAEFTSLNGIEQNWPKFISDLEESDSFRLRQSAISILNGLVQRSISPNTKEIIISHIRNFTKDPVSNVVEYANFVLSNIE